MSDQNGQDHPTDTTLRGSETGLAVQEGIAPGARTRSADGQSAPTGSPAAGQGSGHEAGSARSVSPPVQPVANSPVQSPPAVRRLELRLSVVPLAPGERGAGRQRKNQVALPALPGAAKRRSYGAYIWFAVCVLLPTITVSLYYWLVASKQYAAEFRFTVSNNAVMPLPMASGLLSMLGGVMGANNTEDYMVTDYIVSARAVQELQDRIKVKSLYSKPTIDWWSRFDASEPTEKFVKYWQSMVTTRFDAITGVATAEVRAFSPQDALLIANTLVTLSEELINQIANRTAIDTVHTAAQQVELAQNRLKAIRARLTAYRNKYGVIDPTTSVTASNSSLIQTLRANLAQLETRLETLKSQNLLPTAPAIVALNTQIKSTREQLASTEAQVGNGSAGAGTGVALSTAVAEYEQLNVELQYAKTAVTTAMQALDQARANAAKQQLYITPFVRPSLPQEARYPSAVLGAVTVGMIGFAFWIASLMVMRSIRERFG